ncbi:MAG: hypothetical protein MUF87_05465 [Anaerolineae bacterium]|nr:hypothetical protein [Anaerolineae bacterium]
MHHAPAPDLRIVATHSLHPHEEHDSQRSQPLIESIRRSDYLLNPPIVAPMDEEQYVILDGANRCFSFQALGYPHILVQFATYQSGHVSLDVWHHIVSRWHLQTFLEQVRALDGVSLETGQHPDAIAHILPREGGSYGILASVPTLLERNATLRQVVSLYQRQAILDRTAISEPHEILPLYPEAIALVVFPSYQPADIIAAAQHHAYLPPGISRHIIQGRAIRVNYPMEILRDATASLADKNEALQVWMQGKFAKRQVRYYAEATYQFDE